MTQAPGHLNSRQSHTPATHTSPSTGALIQGSSRAGPSSRVAVPSTPPTPMPMRREIPSWTVWPRVDWMQMMLAMQAYSGPSWPSTPPSSSR